MMWKVRDAANAAVAAAGGDEQRTRIREQLAHVLHPSDDE
jgi:hypothetical protein